MTTSSVPEFDTTLQKTMALLKEIEADLGWENRPHQAYAALRAVLHTVRDRLLPEHAVHLAAQLPMLVRGFFYEGWNPARTPVKIHKEEFINHIRQHFKFAIDMTIDQMIGRVFGVLQRHISPGEWKKIVDAMPKDVREVME